MRKKTLSPSVIVPLVAILLAGAPATLMATPPAGAKVELDGLRWKIGGKLTNPGSTAEGLLLNVRMVNATFEDRNPKTCPKGFDPEKNTDAFIAKIPAYVASGINAFTLCLQGGDAGYEGAINSAFDSGDMNPLVGVVDSNDTSLRTSDDSIRVALINGEPDEEWIQGGPPVDFPYRVKAEGVDENLEARKHLVAKQGGGGRVVTTEPTRLLVSSPGGGFRSSRRLAVSDCSMIRRIVVTARTGNRPTAVSAVKRRQSLPSSTALATSDASARVGRGE